MKLRPVTKLDNRNKTHSKKLVMTSCRKIMRSLLFFRFIANLEQYGNRTANVYSIKLIFILIEPFILQKLKRELKYL